MHTSEGLISFPPDLLDLLEQIEPRVYSGLVYRSVPGPNPLIENRAGARWNPPGIGAIYTSTSPETVRAEIEFQLALNSPPIRAPRKLYVIQVLNERVIDLSTPELIESIKYSEPDLLRTLWSPGCISQVIGGAVQFLGHTGLLVRSARHEGKNLVIYPDQLPPSAVLEVVREEAYES